MLTKSIVNNKQKGFTLIEVLVAIAIFASLSVAAYQVVNQVQRSNELSQVRSQRLQEIQRAFVYMDSDFRQLALRQFRQDGAEPTTRLIVWQPNLLESDTRGLLFTRLGWLNPQNQFPRGEVAKVGYRLVEGKLERLWWRYPDTAVSEPAIELPILSDVEGWNVRFYNGESWLDEWETDLALPQAVEVTLTLKDYQDISRIYLTSGGSVNGASSDES
ncbi:type II secretion system minor pseudopilin GspJ [Vibrio hippocampi]|uniref:Type II secretion system protein J n=1 Tax=Vibrio hippocampi TaxID=654686 RepID=A0ABM8ZED5_9VIBR|nr:type II secretion system minor pseudopilin GspJ [Vibrio hippocampi]CAH0524374.1 Type II secretion system protein J [Vibrio hippocampi]